MFEWSKEMMDKIENNNLKENDLRIIEIVLRKYDCECMILDEAIGLDNNNFFDLKFKIKGEEKCN